MEIFDRFNCQYISEQDLPANIDLGRFCVFQGSECVDITVRVLENHLNSTQDIYINQGLLDDKNKTLQNLFLHFSKKENIDWLNVKPIVQGVKTSFGLEPFEKSLVDSLPHLEAICRQPHYLLNREIAKVNVSRAKRIPQKGYMYLAEHTEDWSHKSILGFKPSRVLHEELTQEYDVYENQVFISLIQKILLYLSSRIVSLENIKAYQDQMEECLNNQKYERGWWKKNAREMTLFGCEENKELFNMSDSNSEETNDEKRKENAKNITETSDQLRSVQRVLRKILSSDLAHEVNSRAAASVVYHDTNVLNDHKHYRYVKKLWFELSRVSEKKLSEKEKYNKEQDVIKGMRAYARSLIVYVVSENFHYKITGSSKAWIATNDYFPKIKFSLLPDESMEINIGGIKKRIVIVYGNCSYKAPHNTEIWGLTMSKSPSSCLKTSPYDVESIERVGKAIRQIILRVITTNLVQKYDLPTIILPYFYSISLPMLDHDERYYWFKGISSNKIDAVKVNKQLGKDASFLKENYRRKKEINDTIADLILRINNQIDSLQDMRSLVDQSVHVFSYKDVPFTYMHCNDGFTLIQSNGYITLKNIEEHYSSLTEEDWGMDYISIKNLVPSA